MQQIVILASSLWKNPSKREREQLESNRSLPPLIKRGIEGGLSNKTSP